MKSAVILLFFLCYLIALSTGVIQEIVFHESFEDHEGNSYIFRKGVPDMTLYNLGSAVRFCHTSRLALYDKINYEGGLTYTNFGSGCKNLTISSHMSFRYFGNKDTSLDGVSLLSGSYLRGPEIYVDRSPFGGINTTIYSAVYTGRSNWTIFEGSNFDGKYACLSGGTGDDSVLVDISTLNMTTVGSLFKGCPSLVTPAMRDGFRKQMLV